MMRTRLVWFTMGLASTSAALSQLFAKDVWAGSHLISSQLKENFGDLDARVSKLEITANASPHQDFSFEKSNGRNLGYIKAVVNARTIGWGGFRIDPSHLLQVAAALI